MYEVKRLSISDPSAPESSSDMPVLVFRPQGDQPTPGLIIAQHLPVAHAGLEGDPFQIDVGERYAKAGYTVAMPWLFHWWPADTPIEQKRAEFRDDQTVADLHATFELLSAEPRVDAKRIGILGHCWGGRVAWLGAASDSRLAACGIFYGGRVKLEFAGGQPAPIGLAGQIRCPVPVPARPRRGRSGRRVLWCAAASSASAKGRFAIAAA